MELQKVPRVSETINFSEEEENVLEYWKQIDAFQTCIKESKGKPRYSFYDGPPFATGLPHYGHIAAGTLKDVVTRYAHQQGFYVERRFGWDCHGLPVEHEIDKKLDIKGPEDVMKMGIDKYNAECRKIVMRYAKEWEEIIGRIGRWIDFKHDYKTLHPSFMESVWWVFKQLYLKGLVYQGNKVMPYSTTCNTPLSNFESGQNYKDVVDPAVTVSLPLINHKYKASLLVWTTTPWTLPSNLSACVHPTLEYVLMEQKSTKEQFIMLECRIETVFQKDDYKIIEKFVGKSLEGARYEPIFPYFANLTDTAFKVLTDNYVTSESGTGIVHQAPYFGEDDYRVCLKSGLITKAQDPICPIDASGRFIDPVTDFKGLHVKEADKHIIAKLKSQKRLIHQGQVKHSYPYCWRSDTPLIYRAVRSWFIRVEHMTQKLQKSSSETYWVPEFVKDKRFGNWLKDARDWAVSRNRYWGTPIPIWMSPNGDEIICIGSISELEKLTGISGIKDIHRESIDNLEIPSKIPGNPPLKRIPEVFDCWFESGSMPIAQNHYPFENAKEFMESFPADFIAEGIDQTRGWFYTLLVISTALFGHAPFKNLVANGLILASDGQKMSKRKKNYPDPLTVVSKYGADALRMYLINSPVVRAENLRFKEEGVRDVLKDLFLPWYNAFRFLFQNIESFVKDNQQSFYYVENSFTPTNIMDRWILSFTQSLLQYIRTEMSLYHLYNVVPRLAKFIDYLTNWYVRMNRKRLKGDEDVDDCKTALLTLFEVLLNIVTMMAPFCPFLTETMYQQLRQLMTNGVNSVHYVMLPEPNSSFINKNIERAVSRMQAVIELGRVVRDRKTIPIKYPLPEIIVVHQDPQYLEDIVSLKNYIHLELNVRKISTTEDKSKFGITLRAEPDYKLLGSRLKQELKAVSTAVQKLTDSEINEMIQDGYKMIANQRIELSEVKLIFKAESINTNQYEVNSDNDVLILLDITPDSGMIDEGTAREIINRIQKLRKKAHLVPTDMITVYYKSVDDLDRVAKEYSEFISNTIKADFKPIDQLTNDPIIMEETQQLKGCNFHLVLTKHSVSLKWINLELVGFKNQFYADANKATVLLEIKNKLITMEGFRTAVLSLFGIESFKLINDKKEIVDYEMLLKMGGKTVFIIPPNKTIDDCQLAVNMTSSFCKIKNFAEGDVTGCLIMENPVGVEVLNEETYNNAINTWVQVYKNVN